MAVLLLKRISKRIHIISKDFKRDMRNFSFKITMTNLLKNLTCLGGPIKRVNKWCVKKRDNQIFSYLYKNNIEVFQKYSGATDCGEDSKEKYVWVCWLQGEENAPQLVKKCIESIRRNTKNYKMTVIDLNNYSEYVKLPDVVVRKFASGNISPAHFSDVLRVYLIRDYGGLWLDATIFCSDEVPTEIFEYSFFSCKSPVIKERYISDYQWTTFVLGGKKNGLFYSFLADFYKSYWCNNDCAVDYLFLDYTIALARRHISAIDNDIEIVPINNTKRDELQACFNEEYNEEKFKEIINSDTYLHKLSWRMDFNMCTDDGKQTFFGFFIDDLKSFRR